MHVKVRLHTTINQADSALIKLYLRLRCQRHPDNIFHALKTFVINIRQNLKSARLIMVVCKRIASSMLSNSSNTRLRTLPGFQSPRAFWKGEPQASLFNARGL